MAIASRSATPSPATASPAVGSPFEASIPSKLPNPALWSGVERRSKLEQELRVALDEITAHRYHAVRSALQNLEA